MSKKVAILFVRKNSVYKSLPDCVCYDMEQNALTFTGGMPVVAHPPCRAWGRLYKFAKPLPGEKELAIWAVSQVRKYGGVLEHPTASKLWAELNLPLGKEIDKYGGWTLSINQHWFGHKAEKRTWLYIVGCSPSQIPDYCPNFTPVTHVVCTTSTKHKRPELSKAGRENTPVQMALWLIELAKLCYEKEIYIK